MLICRGLCVSKPCFLHYIFHRILNDPALFGQLKPEPVQEFGHHSFWTCHCAQAQFGLAFSALDRQQDVQRLDGGNFTHQLPRAGSQSLAA